MKKKQDVLFYTAFIIMFFPFFIMLVYYINEEKIENWLALALWLGPVAGGLLLARVYVLETRGKSCRFEDIIPGIIFNLKNTGVKAGISDVKNVYILGHGKNTYMYHSLTELSDGQYLKDRITGALTKVETKS